MGTQTATILVTDLVGSTAIRGEVGEDRAEEVRRAHDRGLVEAAQANGGTVVKGLGDGLLVMFAGAAEAVAAGVAMQRAVDLLARSERLPLAIRVGVSAGDVTLEDGDCFGAPVVEASRLCAAADGGHVLVAEVVRVLARGRGGHEMTPIGDLELKGLAEPVPTFDVAWEPAAGAADLRTRTPYVGREREREVLAGRIAAACDGAGGLVLVSGEPGIGKTRLTNEVCAQFDDVVTLFGGCYDGDVVPFAPFTEAVTDWVRRSPTDAVRAALGPEAAVVARLAPAIREVVPDVGEPLPVPADAEAARLHDAMGQVLTRLGADAPIVLVVDDLHWADEATVGMLRSLARVAARAPDSWSSGRTARRISTGGTRSPLRSRCSSARSSRPASRSTDSVPTMSSRCSSGCRVTRYRRNSPRCSRPRPTAIPSSCERPCCTSSTRAASKRSTASGWRRRETSASPRGSVTSSGAGSPDSRPTPTSSSPPARCSRSRSRSPSWRP